MTSFNTFVAKEYAAQSDGMKKIYGSLEKFKSYYMANKGLTPWLETLRDKQASLGLLNSMVKTYIEDCNRVPGEIPSTLAYISRSYNLEIPAVEGVLTEDYWRKKADQFHWTIKRPD